MATYMVTGPDGKRYRVTAPEGATEAEVRAQVERQAAPKQKETSFLQGLAEGITPYAANAGRMMERVNPITSILKTGEMAYNAINPSKQPNRIPLLPGATADRAETNLKQAYARSPYQGSTAGKVVGSLAGMLPTMFLPGGVAGQGAAAGLLGNTDKSAKGLATDAALGAIGAKVGDKVLRGAARAVSPKVAPVVQRLKDRGVPLTLGQIAGANGGTAGRMVRGIENKLTSVPGVGDAIVSAQSRGVEGFNRAALKEALAPVKATVPDIGEVGVEQAKQAVRQGYTGALGNVRVTPDRQFADEIVTAAQLGQKSGGFADDFNRIMRDEIGPVLSRDEAISGEGIQNALRMLKGYGRQYGKLATTGASGVPQPSARPAGQAFDDLAASLEALTSRQAPEVMPAYKAADQAYRNVGVVRDAVNAAKVGGGGLFTPAQLSQAARANAKRFGGTHGTTDQPFFGLTRDAQEVLPNTVPNSGTADRGLLGLLLGGTGGIPAVAASGVASIPYSKAGQKAIEWLLTGRQGANARATAKFIESLRPLAVAGGAGGLPLLFGS